MYPPPHMRRRIQVSPSSYDTCTRRLVHCVMNLDVSSSSYDVHVTSSSYEAGILLLI
jgi:hypothetical protein